MKDIKLIKRERRHKRVRAKVFGTAQRPRLAIFRSARHIYAQIINDEEKKTLVSASDLKLKKSDKGKLTQEQENFIAKINESGGLGFVIRSLDDLKSTMGWE